MEHDALVNTLALAIQWAIAPVFLLTGIAGFLAVLTARLGRIIDRARLVEHRLADTETNEQRRPINAEVNVLWRRIGLINWAIRLLVGAALAVCSVVMSLFIGAVTSIDMGTLVAALFVMSMLLIISGLVFLLIEVSISTKRMRAGVSLS
jgi:ABC-type uncharacterized transport system permease subunit